MQNQLQKVFLVFGASGETGKRVIDYLNHWYDINRNLTKKALNIWFSINIFVLQLSMWNGSMYFSVPHGSFNELYKGERTHCTWFLGTSSN